MKIIIPTNDKETLAPFSGRALWFMICDIEDKQLIQTTYIENHHEHEHDHSKGDHGHSHADMVNQLKAYQLMITKKVGPHFGKELQEANIPVEITDLNTIEEVLDTLLNQ